ncbi:MAG: glycine zipper 2TM domain-containing protein [Betaproteobacteria bacterium]|nr:glycine zipper 2TM domain-containing protein [Betaproteobacteria bacterium]
MSESQSPGITTPEPRGQGKSSPIVIIAAISVIIFSAVGVGVMTGIIPSSISKRSETAAPQTATAPAVPAAIVPPAAPATPKTAAPAQSKPAKAAVAKNTAPAKREAPGEPARITSAPPAPPAVCANCGRVEAINAIEQQGEGSGLGAIAGGVVGGILGNQVGSGSGRKIATVAGAAGGAYAGHEIEKRVKTTKSYEVAVRMEDGSARTFPYDSTPAFRVGDRVKVVEGALIAN